MDSPLVLAPMAGYTDVAFRLLAKQHGCGLVTSEMISSHGLVYENEHTKRYLHNDPREAPLSVQIFGADPAVMARAAEMVQENGAHIVDINMGCPVKKVVKTGAGAALLRDLPRVVRILSEVRRAVTGPLTIKIRSGWSANEITAPDVASLAQDMGVDAVAVHPRTARQGFGGSADWDVIKRLKQLISIPVIGNGDVREPSDVVRMMNHTGCDAVMIGRACLGNPWIFSQAAGLLAKKESPFQPSLEDREEAAKLHFTLLKEYIAPQRAVLKMRGQVMLYAKGLPSCSAFRRRMQAIRSDEDFLHTISEYFSFLKQGQGVYEG